VFRRRGHFVECAIDAVPDAEFVSERLEVDIAGFVLDGLLHNDIDKAHYRGVISRLLQFRFIRVLQIAAGKAVQFGHFLNHFGHGPALFGIEQIDGILDVFWSAHQDLAFLVQDEMQLIYQPGIERILSHHGHEFFTAADRHDTVRAGDIRGHQSNHFLGDFASMHLDEFRAQLFGNHLQQRILVDDIIIVEDLLEGLSIADTLIQDFLQLLFRGLVMADQQVPDHAYIC